MSIKVSRVCPPRLSISEIQTPRPSGLLGITPSTFFLFMSLAPLSSRLCPLSTLPDTTLQPLDQHRPKEMRSEPRTQSQLLS